MNRSPARGPAAGAMIGNRYRIVNLIGRGGMAAVYRATDESLGRDVAIKLFATDGDEASALKREASEIRLLASMNHHALVTLFDASVDVADGVERAFLVMELVEGPTLQERISEDDIAAGDIALMALDLAEALHVVHAQGVVHRDIKPANILLSPALSMDREFRAKLADFGIAYLIDSTRLTTPGTLIGTAGYLSPEQADGSAPGAASDIYSLGLVLLESFTRVRAFPGTMVESLSARLIRGPNISGSLGYDWKSLLSAMTAMQPTERPSALEVVEAVRRFSPTATTTSAPTAAATAAATAASTSTSTTVADNAPTRVQPAATEALPSPTRIQPAATEVLPGPTLVQPAATEIHPAATEVFGATRVQTLGHDDATVAFAPASSASSAPSVPSTPAKTAAVSRWKLIAIVAVVAVVMIIAALIWWANATSPSSAELPNVDGDLGVHLKQLMDSITS